MAQYVGDLPKMKYQLPYSGTFSWGAKFHVFRGQSSNAKIKNWINSHAEYFHMQFIGGCGFLALNREYQNPRTFLLRAVEPNSENFPPYVIITGA